MALPAQPSRLIRFGVFELDAVNGELRKAGVSLKMHPQPFRVLLLLAEHAGQAVTREEIQHCLWRDNTFVDFERGINFCINQIRTALGDDAEKPRYVETLPRRGYRFIAPANTIVAPELEEHVSERPAEGLRPVLIPSEEARALLSPTAVPASPSSARLARKRRYLSAVLLTTAITLVAAGMYWRFGGKGKLTEKDTIVLADFTNTTGDSVFDGTLRQGLAIQLEQSPFLNVISDERIHETLRLMDQPGDAKLTPEMARELCQRTASSAVLDGSIAQIGAQYLLTLRAVNCVSGESLASTEAQASDKNHILDALGRTASEIRNKLGESLSSVQKFDLPLEQATTPSLEALKSLSLGQKVLLASGDDDATPFFKRAIEFDPNFALAYAHLGITSTVLGESGAAAGYIRKAYELRDRVSEPEKYFISTLFYKEVSGNIERARQSCEQWVQVYPRSELPHTYLLGAVYPVIGQFEKAVQEGKEAIRLNPDTPIPYAFLMFSYIALHRLDEAKETYEQARGRKLDSPFFHLALYELAFLKNDAVEMATQVAWSADRPGLEDQFWALEADTAAYSGRVRQARNFSRRAMDSAQRTGKKEAATTYVAVSSLLEGLFGDFVEARRRAALAMTGTPNRDSQYLAALALAFSGDRERAQALAADLDRRFPEDTIVRFNYLPTLRAKIAVSQGKASEAIDSLSAAAQYELGQSTATAYDWTALHPAFVRGEAYLAARQGREAAVEFQKILDHRGIVLNSAIGALAHVGLARAYLFQGDTAKAKAAYDDFLALWKDADPDIPILKQARAEYAKLK